MELYPAQTLQELITSVLATEAINVKWLQSRIDLSMEKSREKAVPNVQKASKQDVKDAKIMRKPENSDFKDNEGMLKLRNVNNKKQYRKKGPYGVHCQSTPNTEENLCTKAEKPKFGAGTIVVLSTAS